MSSSSVQPIVALLGLPVAGNPAQYMFEQAFIHHGLDWRYLSLEISPEGLADAVRGMRAMGFRGGNCTEPHKQAIAPYLDRITQPAELTGAVTCVYREANALVGENTEGRGFLEALRRRTDPAGKRAVLVGAGRMARAIAVELALAKAAQIVVVNRSEPSGRALVELLSGKLATAASLVVWDQPYQVPAETQVLVDATSPDGRDPAEPLALDLGRLAPETIVADVTFNPPRTWLLHEASERGCPTIDGLEMFIEQAVLNFRLWTTIDPDPTVLREAVEEFLEL